MSSISNPCLCRKAIATAGINEDEKSAFSLNLATLMSAETEPEVKLQMTPGHRSALRWCSFTLPVHPGDVITSRTHQTHLTLTAASAFFFWGGAKPAASGPRLLPRWIRHWVDLIDARVKRQSSAITLTTRLRQSTQTGAHLRTKKMSR